MKITAIFLFICFSSLSFAQPKQKWGDQKDGTYANPVLPADYSDIDAIRVGDDYYAISSTFQFSPGVIILHSKDLVNWQIISHAVNDLTLISPELKWDKMNHYGKGIWAGSIRYHKGKFWIYFGTPDEGFFMSTAKNPAGPWESLHHLWKVKGWDDCCPFWDEDGQAYFIATNFSDNYKIHLFKMSEDGKKIMLKSDSVIHRSQGSEANKLYKFNGMYYHFFSEANPEGRVAMMERSKSIYGPYEIKQLNHVDQLTDKEPNQGGLVNDRFGEFWFFTHQGTGSWEGRAACLLPVTWINGWPIIGKPGADTIGNMIWKYKKPGGSAYKISIHTSDEFDRPFLQPQWEWNYQPRNEKWSLTEHVNFLRLHAFVPLKINDTADKRLPFHRAGNTLTQRSMRTAKNEVIMKINIAGMADGEYAGLCHFSEMYSCFGVRQEHGNRFLVYNENGKEKKGVLLKQNIIWLKSVWGWSGKSEYSYSLKGNFFKKYGGTYQLSWGFYRGDRISIFNYNELSERGFIDVDWFHYYYADQKAIK